MWAVGGRGAGGRVAQKALPQAPQRACAPMLLCSRVRGLGPCRPRSPSPLRRTPLPACLFGLVWAQEGEGQDIDVTVPLDRDGFHAALARYPIGESGQRALRLPPTGAEGSLRAAAPGPCRGRAVPQQRPWASKGHAACARSAPAVRRATAPQLCVAHALRATGAAWPPGLPTRNRPAVVVSCVAPWCHWCRLAGPCLRANAPQLCVAHAAGATGVAWPGPACPRAQWWSTFSRRGATGASGYTPAGRRPPRRCTTSIQSGTGASALPRCGAESRALRVPATLSAPQGLPARRAEHCRGTKGVMGQARPHCQGARSRGVQPLGRFGRCGR